MPESYSGVSIVNFEYIHVFFYCFYVNFEQMFPVTHTTLRLPRQKE